MASTALPPVSRRLIASGAGSTHPGCVRAVNEDAILTDPTGALWAVADGIGGLGHGDLAADIVTDVLAGMPHGQGGHALLHQALAVADAEIRARAAAEGLGPIGATVVVALVDGDRLTIGWAGDSRCYLHRAGTLRQVTRDHSVVQELVESGQLDAAGAEVHPAAHVITRAVGAAERFEPEYGEIRLLPDDRLLLCSDGLTRCVADAEIAATLDAAPVPAQACRALVEATLARGAPDNVSVVVVNLSGAAA